MPATALGFMFQADIFETVLRKVLGRLHALSPRSVLLTRKKVAGDAGLITHTNLDVIQPADTCCRIKCLSFGKESAHGVKTRLTLIVTELVQRFENCTVQLPQAHLSACIDRRIFFDFSKQLKHSIMGIFNQIKVFNLDEI